MGTDRIGSIVSAGWIVLESLKSASLFSKDQWSDYSERKKRAGDCKRPSDLILEQADDHDNYNDNNLG